jgi:drug/metabolite transporter (DMT)-like permease
MESHISDIAHVIQLAVAPVFLLTAIATMINAMNARLGRIVDRRRVIQDRLREPAGTWHQPAEELEEEMRGLQRRIHLIYRGILFLVLSALLVCLVVAGAFVGALVSVDLSKAVAVLFVMAMITMIISLGMFLREVYLGVSTGSHIIR